MRVKRQKDQANRGRKRLRGKFSGNSSTRETKVDQTVKIYNHSTKNREETLLFIDYKQDT